MSIHPQTLSAPWHVELSSEPAQAWNRLTELREDVFKALKEGCATKVIGKSLEAYVAYM
jgi:DNA-binding NarL/FixJ family response regulator